MVRHDVDWESTDDLLRDLYAVLSAAPVGSRRHGKLADGSRTTSVLFAAFTAEKDGRVAPEAVTEVAIAAWRENPAGAWGSEAEMRTRLERERRRAKSTAELLRLPVSSSMSPGGEARTDLGPLRACWETLRKDAQHSAGLVLAAARSRVPSPHFPHAELSERYLMKATGLPRTTVQRRRKWLLENGFLERGPDIPNPPKRPSWTMRPTPGGFALEPVLRRRDDAA